MKERKVLIWVLIISVCVAVNSYAQGWIRRYDGTGNTTDLAYAIAVDSEGNVYITGSSHNGSSYDYTTLKYNAQGSEQWVARYDARGDGRAIAIDNCGNIYVTGTSFGLGTHFDYATVKYDSLGSEQWVARYDTLNMADRANAIAVDHVGNSYVTGSSFGDYATVKYNAQGSEQWVARYSGSGNGWNCAYAIATDNTGSVYVTGYSLSASGGEDYDYATIKYDSLGSEQWVSRYNGTGDYRDEAQALALDNSGNIYITGWSYGASSSFDYATIKYDSLGNEMWVETFDFTGNGPDRAYALAVDNLGYIHVTGQCYGEGTDDYVTISYYPSGAFYWLGWYNAPSNGPDRANAIAVDNAGYVYVTGESWGWGTDFDYATIKYFPVGIEEHKEIAVKDNYMRQTIFSGSLLLPKGKKCRVFDITGRIITLDNIKPGIYFIEVDGEITQKVIKVK